MSLGQRIGRAFDSMAKVTAGVGKAGGKVAGSVAKAGMKTGSKIGNRVMDGVEAFAEKDKRAMLRNFKNKTKDVGRTFTENVLTDDDSYKHIKVPLVGEVGASFKGNLMDEVATHTRAAGNLAYNVATGFNIPGTKGKIRTPALLKKSEDSLIGIKATGFGTALAITGAGISGIPRGAQTFSEERRGMADGQTVGNAPAAPYTPAYQQNAGATGDLVFALNDMRRG